MTANPLLSYFPSTLAEERLATQAVIVRHVLPCLSFGTGPHNLKIKNQNDKLKRKNLV
jgi:hypothetical protein